MKIALSGLLAATILVLAVPVTAVADSEHSHPGTTQLVDQEELLWWLPADTESVVVARGPFAIPPAPSDTGEDRGWPDRRPPQAEIRLAFERLPLELFEGFDLNNHLQGSTVALAMQGSRHFRDPLPGFDVMDYEGCSIVVFKNNLGARGDSLVRALAKKATRSDIVVGTKVLVFHHKAEQAEWDYFFALPRPNTLLVANNLEYLREVLERMAQRKTPRAFSADLPEWCFLDHAVEFWGLRHYDRSQAKLDPTSPFSEDRTFGPGDDKAIGMLVALDTNDLRTAVIRHFTGDQAKVKEAARQGAFVAEPQERVKFEVKVRSSKPGVLEQVFTLDRAGTLDYFILTVEVALGRGMYF